MKRILIAALLLAACGGSDVGSENPLGVYYLREEPDGRIAELSVLWELKRAGVGRGTKQNIQSFRRDLSESDIAANRALFTPELLTIYRADTAADSGATSTDSSISTIGVNTDRLSPTLLFKFSGTPKSPESAHMVSELDGLIQRLLPTP